MMCSIFLAMNHFSILSQAILKNWRPSVPFCFIVKTLPGDGDCTGASSAGVNCHRVVHCSISNAGTTGCNGNPACIAGREPAAPAGRGHVDGPPPAPGVLKLWLIGEIEYEQATAAPSCTT